MAVAAVAASPLAALEADAAVTTGTAAASGPGIAVENTGGNVEFGVGHSESKVVVGDGAKTAAPLAAPNALSAKTAAPAVDPNAGARARAKALVDAARARAQAQIDAARLKAEQAVEQARAQADEARNRADQQSADAQSRSANSSASASSSTSD
ncbi:MAG: hypothetical protein QOG90_1727 [Actinomycetota bacterium]|jgi:cell division septum initiation protein DivIVA